MIAIAMLLALRAAAALPVVDTAHSATRELKEELGTHEASPPSDPPRSLPPSLPSPPAIPPSLPSPPAMPPMDLVYLVIQGATALGSLTTLIREATETVKNFAAELIGYIMDFVKMLTTLDMILGPADWIPKWMLPKEAPNAPPMMPQPLAPPFKPPSPPQQPPLPPTSPQRDLGEVLDVYLNSVVPAIHFIYPAVFGTEWDDAGRWATQLLEAYNNGERAYTAYEEELLPALHDLEASVSQAYNSTVYGSLAQLTGAVNQLEEAIVSLHED